MKCLIASSVVLRSIFVALVMVVGLTCVSHAEPIPPGETPASPEGTGLAPPITSPLTRRVLDLSGDWRFMPDPFDNGSIDYLSRPMRNGFWRDEARRGPEHRIEYSFDTAETISVPGDWNSQRDDLFFYEGTLWYRKVFKFEPTEGRRTFLWFGAANRHADVWLNGEHLGSHHVGFTPFAFETTGKVRSGENSVVVRVDNRRRSEDVPGMRTDWWNYGGLTRAVALLETPETFARSWEVRLDRAGENIVVSVTMDGPAASSKPIVARIPRLGLEFKLTTDAAGVARGIAPWPERGTLWSPESPELYDIEIVTEEGDLSSDRVGFRTIETRGRDILLNGEPVFLRGICIHEEAPDRPGRAWSEADARKLLGWAKELSCNYVRLAHYTHNQEMVRIADELGLMVWAEIPVYWVLDFENPVTQAYARTHLTEMIERDRNRASVIIWSVGNENEANAQQTALRRDLALHAKRLDPSRLISAACFVRVTRDEDRRLTRLSVRDPFGEFADVLAINEYIGWYGGSTDELAGVPVETAWEKPLLFSEFGAGVKQGLRGPDNEVWTEDFGVRFYRDQLGWCDELRRAGMLQGLSPWILKDFRSPRRPLGGVQDWYNRKGLVSEDGVRKLVFGVVREWYQRWADE
ncbi:MAG: glycoside hydrolase family 2 TIM barrel-domain containing protein [Planctomycetota bacterium]